MSRSKTDTDKKKSHPEAFGELLDEGLLRDKIIPDDEHESLKNSGIGIAQLADGSIDTFPPSEWPKRKAEYDAEQSALENAMAKVFGPQTDGVSDPDDISDLMTRCHSWALGCWLRSSSPSNGPLPVFGSMHLSIRIRLEPYV